MGILFYFITTLVLIAAGFAGYYGVIVRPVIREQEAEQRKREAARPICEDCRHPRCLAARADRQMRWRDAGDARGIYGSDAAADLMRDIERE